MWIRSTGLGKRSDLVTELEELKRDGDYWILHMKTVEPVRWKVRVAITPTDIRLFMGLLFKGGTIFRLVLDLFRRRCPEKPPENY
jgi:hypothetical protein